MTASRLSHRPPYADCLRKIGLVLGAVVLAGGVVGWIIDHHQQLRTAIEFALSIGGHFWPAVVSSATTLTLCAWALCVAAQLPKDAPVRQLKTLLSVAALAALTYFFAYGAMQSTFADFGELNTYAQIAVVVLSVPVLPAFFGIFVFAMAAFDCGRTACEDDDQAQA